VQAYVDGFVNPTSILFIFLFLLVLACAGGIMGLLTRNMIFLVILILSVIPVLVFHQYLPLPTLAHLQIIALKARLGF